MLRSCWMAVAALLVCGVGAATAQTPAYWLGIECLPVMPALRAQLNLSERQGLLVGAVVPESPAAAAGVAQHDVLLRIADKPLAELRDLLQAVDAAKGGKLKIELLRGGKPKTIEVAPAKRPEQFVGAAAQPPTAADWETVRKWMESVTPGQAGAGPWSPRTFTIVRPGAIVPRDVLFQKPLPANMSIVISKEGDQPARIKVRRDGKEWDATEEELDKLPADVRPHVERMLGRGPLGMVGNVQPFFQPPPGPASIDQRIEQRLEEMNGRIDRLFEIMQKMVDGRGGPPPAKK
jgi:hypothetical protein